MRTIHRSRQQTLRWLVLFVFALLLPAAANAAPFSGPAGELYVPEVDWNTIAVIDTASGVVTTRIAVGPIGARPAVLATTLDGAKIYADNFGLFPATVSVITRSTGSVKTVVVGGTPLGAFTSPDGQELYLPEDTFRIEVMSTVTDKVVRTLRFTDIPVAAIAGPDGNLYVGFATGLLGVYDPITGKVIHKPIWSGGLATFWYSFSKDGAKLYTDTINTIGVIDVARWKLVKTINTGTDADYHLNNPGAFTSTLSPDGREVYVTLFGATGVKVIDVATDKIVRTIPTSGSTTGVTFSADGSRGYISDLGPSTVGLKGPIGEAALFADLLTIGVLGRGRVIVFDPATDKQIGEPIITAPGTGISVWLPPA